MCPGLLRARLMSMCHHIQLPLDSLVAWAVLNFYFFCFNLLSVGCGRHHHTQVYTVQGFTCVRQALRPLSFSVSPQTLVGVVVKPTGHVAYLAAFHSILHTARRFPLHYCMFSHLKRMSFAHCHPVSQDIWDRCTFSLASVAYGMSLRPWRRKYCGVPGGGPRSRCWE